MWCKKQQSCFVMGQGKYVGDKTAVRADPKVMKKAATAIL
jgi:hypothetical protein